MTALDTNVLIDLEEGVPAVAEQALRAIESAGERGPIVACGVVYAELCSRPSRGAAEIAAILHAARVVIDLEMPLSLWADAGSAYGAYRKRREKSGGGGSRRIIADFLIGAHACRVGVLVTSDAEFYRRAFPDLRVIDVSPRV